MEKVVWNKKFNIGVDIIDKAHAKLFRIIHKMIDLSNNSTATKHTCQEMVKYLETYSMAHFAEEEEYMRSVHYAGYRHHKQIHDYFRDQTLVSLKKNLELSDYSPASIQHLTDTMQHWLTEHIMKEDQAIVKKTVTKKSYHCSSQADLILRAVNHAMQDVFHIETKLVSTDYKGESIGNGFYCQQCYDIEEGLRLRLLLGLEEPLVHRGLEKIYGKRKLPSLSDRQTSSESLLQIFEPLFAHMGKFFQGQAIHVLDEDSLLDTDGFRTSFMKGYPCSLLFGSKSGYFILCYRTWWVKHE